jgi:multidrug efflux pump subunit AcrA (membrane-fusion protein)
MAHPLIYSSGIVASKNAHLGPEKIMKSMVLVALAVIGGGAVASGADSPPQPKSPIDVYTTIVEPEEIFDPMVFGGFVEANHSFKVATEVAGTVERIAVRVGDTVGRGQRLFSVLPAGNGLDFQPHAVVSPAAGVVTQIVENVGQRVEAGRPVVIVEDISKLKSTIHATIDALSHINQSTPLEVIVRAGTPSERRTFAKIESVAPRADPATGTFPISIRLDCSKFSGQACARMFPLGTMLRVVVKKNQRRGFRLPLVNLHHQQKKVLTLDADGKAKWVEVKLGTFYGDKVEIVEGLADKTTIVTSFAERPDDGDVLKVVPRNKESVSDVAADGNKGKG